jgi:phosphocarrier protein HPr
MADLEASNDAPVTAKLDICNSRGLHARASAKFVKCAERFDAEISVSKDGQTVPGTSIMGLLMLGACTGSTVCVNCSGPEAQQALDALRALVAGKFDEED